MIYSWVEILFTQVVHMYPALLNRAWRDFFILICREHKNMSCGFFGTVLPWSFFWYCQPSIAKYKTRLTSCSDQQFFNCSVFWWYQRRVRKKTADEIPVEGNCQIFFRGRQYEQLEGQEGWRLSATVKIFLILHVFVSIPNWKIKERVEK